MLLLLLAPEGIPGFAAPGEGSLPVQSLCLAWGRARAALGAAYLSGTFVPSVTAGDEGLH